MVIDHGLFILQVTTTLTSWVTTALHQLTISMLMMLAALGLPQNRYGVSYSVGCIERY